MGEGFPGEPIFLKGLFHRPVHLITAWADAGSHGHKNIRPPRYDAIEADLPKVPKPALVYDKYPTDRHHGWKFIRFGPDGWLYVPVGAPCNVCDRGDPYASTTPLKPDGSAMEVVARGVRNSVGFDWHPQTKELWFTDNGAT